MKRKNKMNTKERLQRQIVEYSYINSHLLRSPLSSILGLVQLAEIEESRLVLDKDWLRHLKTSCVELDRVIHKINRLLDERDRFTRGDV